MKISLEDKLDRLDALLESETCPKKVGGFYLDLMSRCGEKIENKEVEGRDGLEFFLSLSPEKRILATRELDERMTDAEAWAVLDRIAA